MSDNKTWIKAYKGFDKDLKCRGRQYTDGVEDHVSDVARLCKEGVHACERPLDVFRYYVPADSVYHEVELAGVLDEHKEDSKICGTDIKVKGKLDIAGLVKAQIEYTKSHCTNKYNAGARGAASAGEFGAATAGEFGAASAGYRGVASAGNYGVASAGYGGAATSRTLLPSRLASLPRVPVMVVQPRVEENLVWAKMELRAAAPIMRV